MSRFIYLVVLKCTGRKCNAHGVIGEDVVASSWYVYFVLRHSFNMYVLLYLFFYVFLTFLLIYMKVTPNVFFRVFFCLVAVFVYLAGDREGAGDHF